MNTAPPSSNTAAAVVAMPRFMDKTFEERGFHDGAMALLQHARHIAIATRRYTCVTVTTGSGPTAKLAATIDTRVPETFTTGVTCSTAIDLSSSDSSCPGAVCAPSGVTLLGTSATSIIFDPLGRSVTSSKGSAGNLAINITNQPSITVYGETGLVK